MINQLLRERPPGYGGVERVAHQLASIWGEAVFSLAPAHQCFDERDPLSVSYRRVSLKSIRLSRFYFPLPSRAFLGLLFSSSPLHGHLPSPEILIILLVAKIIKPERIISVHWHCFLDERRGFSPFIYILYQRMALFILPFLAKSIITTSPSLRNELKILIPSARIDVLPCSLDLNYEKQLLKVEDRISPASCIRVVFIGRLDSYKRVDWLIEALESMPTPWKLSVVGDGPKRKYLESYAISRLGCGNNIRFYGQVNEQFKLKVLMDSHVLVLPSDRCNEAFGIVQLEAMASGIPALAFDYLRSGMAWVSEIGAFPWSRQPLDLSQALSKLLNEDLYNQACQESRKRYMSLFANEVWVEKLHKITTGLMTREIEEVA